MLVGNRGMMWWMDFLSNVLWHVQTGRGIHGEEPCGEGLGGSHGQKAGCEPAVSAHGSESQTSLGAA